MAHQFSAESDDQIPSHPSVLKKPQNPKECYDYIMEKAQEGHSVKDDRQSPITPSASKSHLCNKKEITLEDLVSPLVQDAEEAIGVQAEEFSGRERLNRHRIEVAGKVWIPDKWGQEELLKDWIDCTAFDASLVQSRIMMARAALVEEVSRSRANAIGTAGGLRIENSILPNLNQHQPQTWTVSSPLAVASRSFTY